MNNSIWEEFNSRKQAAWQTKTKAEYEAWQAQFKEWFSMTDFTDSQKKSIKEQITVLNDKKNQFFEKQGNRPIYQKQPTFSPEVQQAMARALNALAAYLDRH